CRTSRNKPLPWVFMEPIGILVDGGMRAGTPEINLESLTVPVRWITCSTGWVDWWLVPASGRDYHASVSGRAGGAAGRSCCGGGARTGKKVNKTIPAEEHK